MAERVGPTFNAPGSRDDPSPRLDGAAAGDGAQFVTAEVYVDAAAAVTQKVYVSPVQSVSEAQPDGVQKPPEQIELGGLQSMSV